MIFLAGKNALPNAQTSETMSTTIKLEVGNTNLMGNYVNNTLYMVIVHPTKVPMSIPSNELEKTSTNASSIYSAIILFYVNPTALSTAISLVYSKILADIDEIKLKKHKNITMILTTMNIMETALPLFSRLDEKSL